LWTGNELIATWDVTGDGSGLGLGAGGDEVTGLLEGLLSGEAWLDVGRFNVQAAMKSARPATNAKARPVPFILPVRVYCSPAQLQRA